MPVQLHLQFQKLIYVHNTINSIYLRLDKQQGMFIKLGHLLSQPFQIIYQLRDRPLSLTFCLLLQILSFILTRKTALITNNCHNLCSVHK